MPGATWKGFATLADAQAAFEEQRQKRQIRAVGDSQQQGQADSDATDVEVDGEEAPRVRSPARGARVRASAHASPAHSARAQARPTQAERQRRRAPSVQVDNESIGELHEVEQGIVRMSMTNQARRPSHDRVETRSARGDPSSEYYSATSSRSGSRRSSSARLEEPTYLEQNNRRRDHADTRNTSSRASGDYRAERQSYSSSPPTEETRYEDGESPLTHMRISGAGDGARQHTSNGHTSARPHQVDLTAPRQAAFNPFREMMSQNANNRDSLGRGGAAMPADVQVVPTVPNSPIEWAEDLPSDPRPVHTLQDACVQGRPDIHNVKTCRLYRDWLKRNPGGRDPLQDNFRGNRLSRSHSEPIAGFASSSAGIRTPSALSAHLTVANLPTTYRQGPTPSASPNTRSHSAPNGAWSANALGLSQGNALSPAARTRNNRNDVRSPIARGSSIPLTA